MPADFLDTNVLIYLLSDDAARAGRAEELLRKSCTISVQVLNELANVARRKLGFEWEALDGLLDTMRALVDVVPIDLAVHERGLRIGRRYGLSVFDAMIIGAALEAGCTTLWSEDMHDGLVIDGTLTIRNPFKA